MVQGAAMENVFSVLSERNFVSQTTDPEELPRLLSRQPVTAYIGFDPTADSLHAGSLLPLMALSHFQRCGHRPIAVLGGGTAMVGDPSGKTEMRKMLTPEEIRQNGEGLRRQFARFIDLDGARALMVDNAEWLLPLNYIDFLRRIGRHFSVNKMLAHESTKIRLEKGLSFLEFNYQLLQAYDFLTLFRREGCMLQMGGDDQWGNIVAGIDLIRREEGKPAYGITFPLLTTASGEKMGKTARGAVWLDARRTPPYDFYQYFRNCDDRDVERFLGFFTFLPMPEVRSLCRGGGQALNHAKEVLATEVTRIVHGDEAAASAQRAARSAFGGAEAGADDIPGLSLDPAQLAAGMLVVDLLAHSGLCASKSAARRLVEQGGAWLGEERVGSIERRLSEQDFARGPVLLRAGKKKVFRLTLAGGAGRPGS